MVRCPVPATRTSGCYGRGQNSEPRGRRGDQPDRRELPAGQAGNTGYRWRIAPESPLARPGRPQQPCLRCRDGHARRESELPGVASKCSGGILGLQASAGQAGASGRRRRRAAEQRTEAIKHDLKWRLRRQSSGKARLRHLFIFSSAGISVGAAATTVVPRAAS